MVRNLSLRLLTSFFLVAGLFMSLFVMSGTTCAATWEQVNNNGFGDANNLGVYSSAVYQKALYMGMGNAANGCELWKYDGNSWTQIVGQGSAGNPNGPGFGDANNTTIFSMAVYNNYLYLGTYNNVGCEIWRYDGSYLSQIVGQGAPGTSSGPGFGDAANAVVLSLVVYNNHLYAGTRNSDDGCEVWRFDGSSWAQANVDGFGKVDNKYVYSMEVYDSGLFAGTRNEVSGCEVWRYNGSNWTQMMSDGFGDTGNDNAYSMEVYNSCLYVGLGSSSTTTSGCEVWRYDGSNWNKMNSDGFGDANNTFALSISACDSGLYVGTKNLITGCELWRYDSNIWSQVNANGFGDKYNQYNRVLNAYEYHIYAGTTNTATGCEVWRALVAPQLDSLSPTYGPAGMQVTLSGSAFGYSRESSYVTFGGVEASAYTSWTNNRITCKVPSGVSGKVEVRVTTVGGTSNARNYDVSASTGGTTSLYFAEGYTGANFHTWLCLQNPNSFPVDVGIIYQTPPGPLQGPQITLSPNSRSTINVNATAGPNLDVSIQVTPNGGFIVAERPVYFNYQGKWDGGHCVVGATSPSNLHYFAEGTTRENFDEWLCLQNPNSQPTTAYITYMFPDTAPHIQEVGIGANSRQTVNVKSAVGPGRDVSVKVESEAPIVAERPMYFNYNGWEGGHCVIGATSPADVLYFAEGTTRENFDEYLCLQNPKPTTAQVKVTYMFQGGGIQEEEWALPPNSRTTLNVKQAVGPERDVSIKISSNTPIVAERPMYFNYERMWKGGHDVMATAYAHTSWYFAEGTTRVGFDEWITIQNPGGTPAQVTITYYLAGGGAIPKTMEVSPHSRATVNVVTEHLGRGTQNLGIDHSTHVTSDIPIICERPMYFAYQAQWDGGHCVMGMGR